MPTPENKIWYAGESGRPWVEYLPRGRIVRMPPWAVETLIDKPPAAPVIYDRFNRPIEKPAVQNEPLDK